MEFIMTKFIKMINKISILSLLVFLLVNIKPLESKEVEKEETLLCDTIVEAIKGEDLNALSNQFDDKVVISKHPLVGLAFNKSEKYNGFYEKKGLLYDLFFNAHKANSELKNSLDFEIASIKDVIVNTNNYGCYLDEEIPQLSIKYKNSSYNFLFKRFNKKFFKISTIVINDPF